MAFIYAAGGFVIRVPATREAIVNTLTQASDGTHVEFETEGHGSRQPVKVSSIPAKSSP